METNEKKEINSRYNKRINEFGYTDLSLGWTRPNVEIRLNNLLSLIPSKTPYKSILDFGCGLGALYNIINEDLKVNYIGYDINDNYISHCKQKYSSGRWICGELSQLDLLKFDLAFFSGVFNHKLQNNDEWSFFTETITKIYNQSRFGVVFNLLSDRVEYLTNHNYNFNAERVLSFCYSLSNSVIIDNTALRFEFSCGIFKSTLNLDTLTHEY
jgi:SAM-dependent methyltransferase